MLNPYVILAAAAIVFGAYVTGHYKGYSEADQRARVAELQADLNAARQDLAAEQTAAEMSRRAADENQRTAAASQKRLEDYEAELQKRGDANRCRLGPDDIIRLQRDGGASASPKPARR